jgi:glycosyltransferase involved in cell wall biosynthesis
MPQGTRLILVGEGTEALGNGSSILGLGAKENVMDYMAAADVLVNPSLLESSPTVVREAMSCGLPCIVTLVGDACDVVDDTGWCVGPEQGRLLEALMQVASIGTDELRRRGSIARQRVVQTMNQDTMVQAYLAFFKQVADH